MGWNLFTRKAPVSNGRSIWNRMTGKTTASRNNLKKRRSTSVAGLLNTSKINAAKGASGSLIAKHTNNSKAIGERRELVAKRAAAATQRLLAKKERNASGKRNLNKNAENDRLNAEDREINEGLNEMLRGFEDQFNAIDVQVKLLKLNEEVDALKKELGSDDANTTSNLNKIREIFNKYRAYFSKDKAFADKIKMAIQSVIETESLDGITDPKIKDIIAFMIPLMEHILPIMGPAFKGAGYTPDLPAKFHALAVKLSGSQSMRGGRTEQETTNAKARGQALVSIPIGLVTGILVACFTFPAVMGIVIIPIIWFVVLKIRQSINKKQHPELYSSPEKPSNIRAANVLVAVTAPLSVPVHISSTPVVTNGIGNSLVDALANIFGAFMY